MTNEQIKQNAEEYAINSGYEPLPKGGWIDCTATDTYGISVDSYIEGAHSRDEEITGYQMQINMTADALQQCVDELEQLRNPWISVEEHPDDVTKDYLLEYEDGSHIVAMWDSGMWMSKNLYPLKEPTHWMLIPN